MNLQRTAPALAFASLLLVLTGCGLEDSPVRVGPKTGGKPLATEACGLVRDAGRILLSNNKPSRNADVLDRSVNKAVRTAHRATKVNPDYSGVYRGTKLTKRAVESGDSRALTKAIRVTAFECGKALGTSFKFAK